MQLTKNGIHRITNDSQGTHAVLVSGSLGGGTAALGYFAGGFVPLADGALAVGKQVKVEAGVGVDLYIELKGSTGAKLDVLAGGL